jgi:hypothetical protein
MVEADDMLLVLCKLDVDKSGFADVVAENSDGVDNDDDEAVVAAVDIGSIVF